jgi:hypothetical protein
MSYNKLNEPIEKHISNLQSLEVLFLQYNEIWGPLPSEITLLSKLEHLNLSYNNISGILPDSFGQLTNLKLCNVKQNLITGPIPSSVSKLKHLNHFQVFVSPGSETMSLPEGFNRRTFERVFCWGHSVGIDVVSWIPPEPYYEGDSIYFSGNNGENNANSELGNNHSVTDSDDDYEG